MDRVTYQEILKDLEEIAQWLCGVTHRQFDRIRVHQRNVAALAQATNEGTLDQFIAGLGADKRREVMCSLTESMEFVDSIKALRKQDCRIPVPVLEAALDGPADLHFKDENSNRGRNTMFEIAIAGRVARAGLTPELGGEPDVRFDLEGRQILIECKRVFSEKGIARCLAVAGRQLKRDLARSCDPRDCGIIAVSISRVFNQGDKMFVARNEDMLRERLREEVDSVIQRQEGTYRNVRDPKIAGFLFHLSTPAFLEDVGLFMAAHSVTIHHIPGRSDSALLRKLAECIG